jgi:hypothetical protein
MEIVFANKTQCAIADLLWACKTIEDVQAVIRVFGREAEVVYNMIVAAAFDAELAKQEEFPEVMEILEALK